jgi:uncharacterized protein GlcG (DUF336 family)
MKTIKKILGSGILLALVAFASVFATASAKPLGERYNVMRTDSLTRANREISLSGAVLLAQRARAYAKTLNRDIAVAIVDAGGNIILLNRENLAGPHNAEAARRKAYTSLSTKTSTLVLALSSTSKAGNGNLTTVPGLLLLGGGMPLYHGKDCIGAIGIAGGGGPENDDLIARNAILEPN